MFWNIIIGLVLLIIGYVIMPKPKAAKPDAVSELEAPTAEAGRPITVIFGDLTVKSPNFLWWGDKKYVMKKERTGKK